MNVFVVNGAITSGKDEFCKKVVEITTPTYGAVFSTIDLVKEIAYKIGWDGAKTPRNRKFLSDLKDLLTKWGDIPNKDIEKRINNFLYNIRYFGLDENEAVVFIMCREPEEIQKLQQKFGAKTLLVRRKEAEEEEPSNHADREVLNYNYDIEIDNNGTLLDLAYKALEFVEKEKLHIKHWESIKIDLFGNIGYVK